ncbi:uncharacterized protein ACIBXB_006824 [Morphnus guianensis]
MGNPRKLQLPACPEGTPLPFPPTPTPAQPQSPPSPQRRSGQLRRAPAAGSGTARHPPPGSGQRPPPPRRHGSASPRGRSARPTQTPPSSSGLSPGPAGRLRSPATGPAPARSCGTEILNKTPEHQWEAKKQALRLWNERLGNCQVSSFRFTQVHHRGHKGDFFQREDRVIKSKVHYLLLSFRKSSHRFCFLDLPGTSQSRRLELQHYTLTGIIFCFRERCEELCESRAMVLAENTSAPAGVRSTLDLVPSHSQGPVWVAKTVTEIRNKTP